MIYGVNHNIEYTGGQPRGQPLGEFEPLAQRAPNPPVPLRDMPSGAPLAPLTAAERAGTGYQRVAAMLARRRGAGAASFVIDEAGCDDDDEAEVEEQPTRADAAFIDDRDSDDMSVRSW